MDINGIEWWMIDGGVCLIMAAAAITGLARGAGDTIIRILGVACGGAAAFFYSDRLAGYIKETKAGKTLRGHIFQIVRGEEGQAMLGGGDDGASKLPDIIAGRENGQTEVLSKSLTGFFNSAADKAADQAAGRLTDLAVSILSFAAIILAAVLAAALIRALMRAFRKKSLVIGFADRVLGFVLGAVRGVLLAWVAVAVLIPVTTIVAPGSVPDMVSALRSTRVANVIYDVNPLLYIVKLLLK